MVALWVTLGIFMFPKCEISSTGSLCTFLAFLLLYQSCQVDLVEEVSTAFVFCYGYGKNTRLSVGQDLLSFWLDLQTFRVWRAPRVGEVMSRCPPDPHTPAQALHNSPGKYAGLLSGANFRNAHQLLNFLVGEESKWKSAH